MKPERYVPIDYAAVRSQIPMSLVLELLGFEPTRIRGSQYRGRCLLPDCGGKSFSVNVSRNAWHCFACRRGGNQLDLWSRLNAGSFYASTKRLCTLAGIPVPYLPQ